MRPELPENAILLPRAAQQMRYLILPDGSRAASQDASYLPFMIEEMIRFSAVELAIDPGSQFYAATASLPHTFRKRIRKVDEAQVAREKTYAVLAPVCTALDVEFPHGALTVPEHMSTEVASALVSLCGSLELFLIGVDHQVQVDVNYHVMLDAVRVLTEVVKGAEARANLATLEGVLRTYDPLEVPSLVLRAQAGVGLSRVFHEFVEDETYRLLAREAGLLGIPTRASYALVRMRRAAASLVEKPRFRAAADVTAETIKASSTIPAPTSKVGQILLNHQHYLPPLVSLRDAHERAVAKWTDAAPPFVSTSGPAYDGARPIPPGSPEARALGFEAITDQ